MPMGGEAVFLIVDNYDSFTYNLVQFLGRLGVATTVHRNDALSVEDVARLGLEAIVLSPGPGTPAQAGICVPLIQALAGRVPVFGVCLGMQAIAVAFGGAIVAAQRPMHGKQAPVWHSGQGCLRGMPSPLTVCRYHSLVVDSDRVPPELTVTARSAEGEVMALRHRDALVEGVQFHPESAFTRRGIDMLANFVADVRTGSSAPRAAQAEVVLGHV